MVRDNAACNRAIRKAWEKERELVLAGKGTRNWTPEQREQLISMGKVYDDDGKAFIGQHMKSANGYPDYQGDVDNIQLLSLTEHLEAHKGNWRNVTNWYYDPDTKEYFDFDIYDYNDYPPVITFELPESIHNEPPAEEKQSNSTEEQQNVTEDDDLSQKHETETFHKNTLTNSDISSKVQPIIPSSDNNWKGKIKGVFKTIGKKAIDAAIYAKNNPDEIQELVISITNFVITINNAKTQHQINKINRERTKSISASYNRKNTPSTIKSKVPTTTEPIKSKNTSPEKNAPLTPPNNLNKSQEVINRTSPKEHTVKAHQQRYHTKEGIKVVEKDSFSRGGRKKEDD